MSHNEEFVPRRKRRARDDPMERNFICVCGKKYLSYPALYTHIKNKHEGKAPNPGEVADNPQISRMRVTREEPENEHEKHLSTPDEALVYVINTFKPYSSTKQLNYTVDEIFRQFPEELKKEIMERTRSACEEKVQVEKVHDNGIKAVNIDDIMAKFLSLLVHKIDKTLLEEFIFILLILRKYLNTQFEGKAKDFTQETTGMKMLDGANEFVLYYFDKIKEEVGHCFEDSCFIDRPRR